MRVPLVLVGCLLAVALAKAKVKTDDKAADKPKYKKTDKIADKNLDEKGHVNAAGEHEAKYDHEAFLGKDEAAATEELSPEKSKERLGMLVPKIDKNGDGEITEAEMKDHINFMQQRYVNNDVARTWKQYNEEEVKGGKLSWKHYKERVYGPDTEEMSDDYKRMIKRDRRRWEKADTTKDDSLEKEEYACFMHPEDCGSMRDIVVKETVEDIDKDADGFVTLDEYLNDMYRPEDYPDLKPGQEPEWVQSEREMFKEHRDKNGDGKMDFEEMREWISPTGFDHAEAEAHHLIHMSDDDKDGKLSLDEVLAHHDVFIGSQATDYGEVLQKHDPAEL